MKTHLNTLSITLDGGCLRKDDETKLRAPKATKT
jgi:hypothetical protein